MFTMRDAIIRAAGFEWPHLFASCFALMPDGQNLLQKEGVENYDLLHITQPQMIATTQYILMN